MIKKSKNTLPCTFIISHVNDEEIAGRFYKKELQKRNQKDFRVEKVIKRTGDKLYVKSKDYRTNLLTVGLIKKGYHYIK